MPPPTNRVYVPGVKPPVIGLCENCLFFKATIADSGECRRYPPTVHVLPIHGAEEPCTFFPQIAKKDGCGEYASRAVSQATTGDLTAQRTKMSDG